jgi:hypothetical protein
MGTPAEEVVQDDAVIDEAVETVDEVIADPIEPELDDNGEPVAVEEAEEVEIVREGTQPQFNQQEVNDIVSKRVNKLNAKVTEATEGAGQASTELELERERSKILQLALDQAKGAVKPKELSLPNPEEFNEGVSDPGYIQQQGEYTQALISKGIAEGLAKVTEANSNTHSQNQQDEVLLSKQVKHYERAEKLGVKDYGAIEDKAIGILGTDSVKYIIETFDDSQLILAYLGTEKNHDETRNIASLVKQNPGMALAEIGALRAGLKVKSKSKAAPDPDEEIQGGITSSRRKKKGPTFE